MSKTFRSKHATFACKTSHTHNRRFAKPKTRDPASGNCSVVTSTHIKLSKPTGHVMHQKFNIQQLYALPQNVFMCFVFIWEQTATCATYSINWLVFITEMKSVYSTVRTGSLNKAVCASSLKPTGHVMHQQFNIQQLYALPQNVFMCFVFIWEQTATCATYSINWLVFITQMKSVYSTVRTVYLNKAGVFSLGWIKNVLNVHFSAHFALWRWQMETCRLGCASHFRKWNDPLHNNPC